MCLSHRVVVPQAPINGTAIRVAPSRMLGAASGGSPAFFSYVCSSEWSGRRRPPTALPFKTISVPGQQQSVEVTSPLCSCLSGPSPPPVAFFHSAAALLRFSHHLTAGVNVWMMEHMQQVANFTARMSHTRHPTPPRSMIETPLGPTRPTRADPADPCLAVPCCTDIRRPTWRASSGASWLDERRHYSPPAKNNLHCYLD